MCCHYHSTKTQKTNIDWGKRDEELLPIVLNCISALKNAEPAARITMYGISRYLVMPKIHLTMSNMPMTKKAIDDAVETPEEFKKRRLATENKPNES